MTTFSDTRAGRWIRYSILSLYIVLSSVIAFHVYRVLVPINIKQQDIYFYWMEGHRLYRGENPYARILDGNMLENRGMYPTCLPMFYVAAAAGHLSGIRRFEDFIPPWTIACLGAHVAIGFLLLTIVSRKSGMTAGLCASGFWLINRWSLYVLSTRCMDGLPILILIASLALFGRRRATSCLLLGLSLSLKHIGIFLVPLYLIWAGRPVSPELSQRPYRVLKTLGQILLIPCLISLPFAIWDPNAFARSLLFSGTRLPMTEVGAVTLDAYLGVVGLLAKLPMLIIMLLIYIGVCRGAFHRYGASLFCLAAFTGLNSVAFPQYLAWCTPFLPLAVTEWKAFWPADGETA